MHNIIVIGENWNETSQFAHENGMRAVRHVVSRDTIRGLRPDVVYLLPGFDRRRDLHSINAEIRQMGFRNPNLDIVSIPASEPVEPVSEDSLSAAPDKGSQDDPKTEPVSPEPTIDLDPDAAAQIVAALEAPEAAAKPKAKSKGKKVESDDFFTFLDGE